MKIENFFGELKRRNVFKVAVAYAIVGWLLVCQILPLSADAWRGPYLIQNLAVIYETIGDSDHAIEQLRTAAEVQNGVHYGELKRSPRWDALRADPRFDKIVNSLAPR
jgi:hypothetical protein